MVAMSTEIQTSKGAWQLFVGVALSLFLPFFGTISLAYLFPDWSWVSIQVHSSIEVLGAAFGVVLAVFMLASPQKLTTSRRLWMACALTSMAVLDIAHGCMPPGTVFVWLHSIAVLAAGLFISLVWLPRVAIPRGYAWTVWSVVFFGSVLVALLSIGFGERLPRMEYRGIFTSAARMINLFGGLMLLLSAVHFGKRYYLLRDKEDFLFLLICILFGSSGVIFQASKSWHAGWWFWHALRFSGYTLFWLAWLSSRAVQSALMEEWIQHAVAIAQGDYKTKIIPHNERDQLGLALQRTAEALERHHEQEIQQNWLNEGVAAINDCMRGDPAILELSHNVICEVARRLNVQLGAFYVLMDGQDPVPGQEENFARFQEHKFGVPASVLRLTGSYAFDRRKNLSCSFMPGQGVVGQAAVEKQNIILSNVPSDYTQICSSLIEGAPRHICASPFMVSDRVLGVIELGVLHELSPLQLEYLERVLPAVAVAIEAALGRARLSRALTASQLLSEELREQQGVLQASNAKLLKQTELLQQSEEQLQHQQEELRMANEELEEKSDSLVLQTEQVRAKNRLLENTQRKLKQKADDLTAANRYKSEFLANMSHELRTPLNSLLVLAHHLAENRTGNLIEDQVESAQVIAASGECLLQLINDILDLSKIEAGKMLPILREVYLEELVTQTRKNFAHMAEQKGLLFEVVVDPEVPGTLHTDPQRLMQIIRNLVGNSLKFTHEGGITIRFSRPEENAMAISVKDTGIGIPADKLKAIFEAFQQGDGSISRQYGGTGLGLSITRELAALLGGKVLVESEENCGSTFTILLPSFGTATRKNETAVAEENTPEEEDRKSDSKVALSPFSVDYHPIPSIPDDRESIQETDRVVLVIEDDPEFAKVLGRLARNKHFKFLHAPDGPIGLKIAGEYQPEAIILDIRMPGMDGWKVLEALKGNVHTRHIPVHIMSAEEQRFDPVQRGAIAYLTKPISANELEKAFTQIEQLVSRSVKDLLIVEDDDNMQIALEKLLGSSDVKITAARTIKEALEALTQDTFDCMVLDLNLPDGFGLELLDALAKNDFVPVPPVIVHTGEEISPEMEEKLREYAASIIIKGPMAEERLVDETALFLHQVVEKMPDYKKEMVLRLHDRDRQIEGKTVLLVDDDMRNVFALSRVLEGKGLKVRKAADGEKALQRLRECPEIDLVLMDIMMPNMDGYEAMRRIRDQETDLPNHEVPIIALTAKAMKGDRGKCIEAGANDYLSKPVDTDRLWSLIRVWLGR